MNALNYCLLHALLSLNLVNWMALLVVNLLMLLRVSLGDSPGTLLDWACITSCVSMVLYGSYSKSWKEELEGAMAEAPVPLQYLIGVCFLWSMGTCAAMAWLDLGSFPLAMAAGSLWLCALSSGTLLTARARWKA